LTITADEYGNEKHRQNRKNLPKKQKIMPETFKKKDFNQIRNISGC
jgi:hypothetical protein